MDRYEVLDGELTGGYRLVRRYRLNSTPISLDWIVRLPAGRRFVLFDLRIRNHGETSIRLDQDQGDTHDGIQLVSRFGLAEPGESSENRFTVQNVGERLFAAQPRWKTYPNARWVSVSGRDRGATLVFLRGDTAPKMVVVHERSLSYLVNEVVLRPDRQVNYRIGIYVHEQSPGPREGRTAYRAIRRWTRSSVNEAIHSPSG